MGAKKYRIPDLSALRLEAFKRGFLDGVTASGYAMNGLLPAPKPSKVMPHYRHDGLLSDARAIGGDMDRATKGLK
jgi:hypothetical protein